MGRGKRLGAWVSAVLLVGLVIAVPSRAASLTLEPGGDFGDVLRYRDSWWNTAQTAIIEFRQVNRVVFSTSPHGVVTISDGAQPILPGPYNFPVDWIPLLQQCQLSLGNAVCTPALPYREIEFNLGFRDDQATLNGQLAPEYSHLGALRVRAGAGSDRVIGSPADDSLIGAGAGDRLEAADGEDNILGGAGNDVLIAGPGGDNVDLASRFFGTPSEADGNDQIDLGPGEDWATAPDDGDRVEARDGERDHIFCLGSAAVVIADAIDDLHNCPNAQTA